LVLCLVENHEVIGLYYKVPMQYAHWGAGELMTVLSASVKPPVNSPRRLTSRLEMLYGGKVSMWNSGRAALEAALQQIASGTSRKDVLTPSLVCRSVPEKIVAAGLRPVFYDCRPDFTPDIAQALELMGDSTAALIVAFLYGGLSDISGLHAACAEKGIQLVEDCASTYLLRDAQGKLSGTEGDYTILSFGTGKTIVAGGGGVLIQRVPGPSPEPPACTAAEERFLSREKLFFALNFAWPSVGYPISRILRLSSDGTPRASLPHAIAQVEAELVHVQESRFQKLLAKRTRIIEHYANNLRGLSDVGLPQYRQGCYVNRLFVEFPTNVNNPRLPRLGAASAMRALGVQVHLPYSPTHCDPAFQNGKPASCPVADRLADQCLAVPTNPNLRDRDIDFVCEAISTVIRQADRPSQGQ
jgi:dTDP-4-amino-4,6-dideoxygalactose transaminase